jgi:hypothetical protein
MTATTLPVAADLEPETPRTLRVEVVKTGEWPAPATALGHAEGPDAQDIAAEARAIFDQTGRVPADLPGFVVAGE